MYRIIILLMVVQIAFVVCPMQAQTYAITDELTLVGGLKDTLYTAPSDIDTKLLDSLHLYVERADSLNWRLLAAAVPIGITATSSEILKDTVLIKADTNIGGGSAGITWQRIQQAFSGAVPPKIRLFLFVDKDGTAFWRRLITAAISVKEMAYAGIR